MRNSDLDNIHKLQAMVAPTYVHAHYLGYGLSKYFRMTERAQYITMLRNPVERVFSLLYHSRGEQFNCWEDAFEVFLSGNAKNASTDAIGARLKRASLDNTMTRTLGSEDGRIGEGIEPCDEKTFELAEKRLSEIIDVVMITEFFDESVLLLSKKLGLKSPFYRRINLTSSNARPSIRPDAEICLFRQFKEFFEKRDHYDAALYKQALERFLMEFNTSFDDAENALAACRRMCRIVGIGLLVADMLIPGKTFFYKSILTGR